MLTHKTITSLHENTAPAILILDGGINFGDYPSDLFFKSLIRELNNNPTVQRIYLQNFSAAEITKLKPVFLASKRPIAFGIMSISLEAVQAAMEMLVGTNVGSLAMVDPSPEAADTIMVGLPKTNITEMALINLTLGAMQVVLKGLARDKINVLQLGKLLPEATQYLMSSIPSSIRRIHLDALPDESLHILYSVLSRNGNRPIISWNDATISKEWQANFIALNAPDAYPLSLKVIGQVHGNESPAILTLSRGINYGGYSIECFFADFISALNHNTSTRSICFEQLPSDEVSLIMSCLPAVTRQMGLVLRGLAPEAVRAAMQNFSEVITGIVLEELTDEALDIVYQTLRAGNFKLIIDFMALSPEWQDKFKALCGPAAGDKNGERKRKSGSSGCTEGIDRDRITPRTPAQLAAAANVAPSASHFSHARGEAVPAARAASAATNGVSSMEGIDLHTKVP